MPAPGRWHSSPQTPPIFPPFTPASSGRFPHPTFAPSPVTARAAARTRAQGTLLHQKPRLLRQPPDLRAQCALVVEPLVGDCCLAKGRGHDQGHQRIAPRSRTFCSTGGALTGREEMEHSNPSPGAGLCCYAPRPIQNFGPSGFHPVAETAMRSQKTLDRSGQPSWHQAHGRSPKPCTAQTWPPFATTRRSGRIRIINARRHDHILWAYPANTVTTPRFAFWLPPPSGAGRQYRRHRPDP